MTDQSKLSSTVPNGHPLLWSILSLPAAVMTYRYMSGADTYGEFIHVTGELSARLLIVTLAITPLRLMFRGARWTSWLLERRRAIGVAVFAYAALHTAAYLIRKAELDRIVQEGLQPELLTGWIALLVFGVLAATSNDASVRRLGRSWKALHRAVYLATALTFAHWILAAFDPVPGAIHLAVAAALEACRLVLAARARKRAGVRSAQE
jgi:sulfoxide reductase heme-binding subunit YedZ